MTSTLASALGVDAPARGSAPCAACAAAWRGSPTAARSPPPRVVGVEQLPRNAGGAAVELDQHLGRAAEERLHLRPAPAAGTACGRSACRWFASFDALATRSRSSATLRRLRAHFGARPLGVERVDDRGSPFGPCCVIARDEVVVGAAIARVERARAARRRRSAPRRSRRKRPGVAVACICSARQASVARSRYSSIEVQVARPAASRVPREALVGFAHALRDQLRRLARRDAGAAAADQRGRQLERSPARRPCFSASRCAQAITAWRTVCTRSMRAAACLLRRGPTTITASGRGSRHGLSDRRAC